MFEKRLAIRQNRIRIQQDRTPSLIINLKNLITKLKNRIQLLMIEYDTRTLAEFTPHISYVLYVRPSGCSGVRLDWPSGFVRWGNSFMKGTGTDNEFYRG